MKERLDGVLIENKSFTKLIPAQDGKGTLFYCAPPYHNTEKYYDTGEDVFNEEMHILLRDTLKVSKENLFYHIMMMNLSESFIRILSLKKWSGLII